MVLLPAKVLVQPEEMVRLQLLNLVEPVVVVAQLMELEVLVTLVVPGVYPVAPVVVVVVVVAQAPLFGEEMVVTVVEVKFVFGAGRR